MADSSPAAPPPQTLALPLEPALRGGLWALPLLLSLFFVAGVLAWLHHAETMEREQQRLELISDALTLRSDISGRLENERLRLVALGRHLHAAAALADTFDSLPDVQQGLHRFWLGLTWLDASNRIVAAVPKLERRSGAALPSLSAVVEKPTGLTAHLSVRMDTGGSLVARYSPTELLRQNVPWWLARKYDVRLIDAFGDEIATTDPGFSPLRDRPGYRIAMEPAADDRFLELIARDRVAPWLQGMPLLMMAGFVVLIGGTTALLRRQVREVTRAEAAWRNEAAWRSAMEDSLTVGLRARDLEGRILYVNRTLADMVGFEPEELHGLMPPMPYWPADSIEEIMQRHRRNLAGEAPREGYEARWRHRDGRVFDVMVFEAPLVDAQGRQIGWMGSILDLTERKRMEERERRQTESMAHNARLTMLGEVASALAHELNQPLSAIASYNAGVLNSLRRQAAPDPVVIRALQRLGEQSEHAGRIVQRIREFLTRREPRLEPCQLNAVVQDAAALLQRELSRLQVQLSLALDPALPVLVADSVLIEQVVINLVRNAADALGSVSADAGATPRRIELRTAVSSDGRTVRLDVLDNGPGLGGTPVEALCAPFYSTKAEGMGMGLAICRSIVEAHYGALDARDLAGGGACFSLSLRIDAARLEPAAAAPPSPLEQAA